MRRVKYSWIVLAAAFVILFFNAGSRFSFGLMLKPMAEDLGWSRSSLSLAVTVFMIVSALGVPVVGRLVDRYSVRTILATGAALAAVGIGLMGRVSSLWQVFALYGFVYAVGNAATSITPVGVLISRWFPSRRGMANSAAISGNAIGQLVILTLLASSLASLGWRASFAILGAAYVAIVVPVVLAAVRTAPTNGLASHGQSPAAGRTPVSPGAAASLGAVLASRQLWLLAIIYTVCGFQDFFVATHVVAFALDKGMGSVLAGNMLALMGLMGLFGVLVSGLSSDAWGAARPTALCFLLRVAIFAIVIFFQATGGILAFALLYGFTFLITAPLTLVFAANMFGSERLGTVSGIISMVHAIAGGAGAFVGAFIYDTWGSYDAAFVLMLGLSLVATVATLLLKEKVPAPAPA